MPEGKSVGAWIGTIIGVVVLLAVVAGTYPAMLTQAKAFNTSTSGNSLASTLVTLLPIIVAAALLLVVVFEFLPIGGSSRYSRHKRRR